MKKALLFLLLSVVLLSCSGSYKGASFSEQVSRTVFAVNDSIKAGRIEMAESYSEETIRLITPPKDRIFVGEITKNKQEGLQSVIIVPEWFKGKEVIVVGTKEYNDLIKSADIRKQFEKELDALQKAKADVDEELRKERERVVKLETDLTSAKVTIGEQSSAIWKRNCIILVMGLLIAAYFYIKARGLIPLPF